MRLLTVMFGLCLCGVLAGCAWTPPKAYPILNVKDHTYPPDESKSQEVVYTFIMTEAKDLPSTKRHLQEQAIVYSEKAAMANRGHFDLRTGMMGGAMVGAVGVLIDNVATIASGAGLVLGSGLMNEQYSLTAQGPIYATAAARVICISSAATMIETSLSSLQSPHASRLIFAVQDAANRVLARTQASLASLRPEPPNLNALLSAYMQARNAKLPSGQVKTLTADQKDALAAAFIKAELVKCVEAGDLQINPGVPESPASDDGNGDGGSGGGNEGTS